MTYVQANLQFVISKDWKQTKCPSIGDQLNKLWYTHSVEYYRAIKTNDDDLKSSLDSDIERSPLSLKSKV